MKKPSRVRGAIYDVDDTLLSNQPEPGNPIANLHQISRLQALRDYAAKHADKYGVLAEISPEENFESFAQAPVHTVAGAFYVLLQRYGLIAGGFDPSDPVIIELVESKNRVYRDILLVSGNAIDGADHFVRGIATKYQLDQTSAIASSGNYDDIVSFVSKYQLRDLFPDERIIDLAKVVRPKPDAEPFDKAFQATGLADQLRGEVIAIEDDPRGLLSARNAGLFVCAITSRYSRDELNDSAAHPDFVFDTYAELSDYFGLS